MRLSATDLGLIDARASTLSERLAGGFVAADGNLGSAERRLARLKSFVAEDDSCPLASRINALATGEVTEASLLAVLSHTKRAAQASVPQWHSDLNSVVEGVAESFESGAGGGSSAERPHRTGREIPYEHLYWPIADLACRTAVLEYSNSSIWLAGRALFGLQDSLVRRLSGILSSVLHPAFLAHKSAVSSSMMQHFFDAKTPQGTTEARRRQYAKFIVEQGEGGLASVFMAFPVAARLVAQVTRFWIDFVREFLERLAHDEKEIAMRFNAGAPLGRLVSVQAGLSDSHHDGRSVLLLRFRGGLRLVYKPRPMGIDHQFSELVRVINAQTPDLDLRVLKILDRGLYGWMEFARHEACSNACAARRYFQRAGALACLTHWLQGIDFHRENVIAAGEQPLLLDMECLAHPLRGDELTAVDAPPSSCLAQSVLRTGLLPIWQFGIKGVGRYDNCGLNAAITQRSLFASMQWKEVNTDRMHWVNEKSYLRHSEHRAFLGKRALPIESFERQVCGGYRRMTCILEGSDAKMYSELRDQIYRHTSRRIKRPTFLYAMVLRRSLHPSCLSDGVDRSIELLTLPCNRGDEEDWASEIASLEKLDVPYFQYPARSKLPPSHVSATSLAQQAKMVSASVRRQVKLDAGKVVIMPTKNKRSHSLKPTRSTCSDL